MSNNNNEFILSNRIYPAISSCVSNRYKIVSGLFAVYAFIASSLNTNKDIINQDVAFYSALVFTFFVIHNLLNYGFNACEQYELEDELEGKKSEDMAHSETKGRYLDILKAEGLFSFIMIVVIWYGYFYIIKPMFCGCV